jgi:hypothetical protein
VQLDDSDGSAALGICESLLLSLINLQVITEDVARDLLADVAATHTNAAALSPTPATHQAVVQSVQRIQRSIGYGKLGA